MRRAPLFVAIVLTACSGGSGDPGPQPPQCTTAYEACSSPSACCTSDCVDGSCAPSSVGEACRTTADCLPTLTCSSSVCTNPACRVDEATCSFSGQCCAGNCRPNGTCGANRPPVAAAGADFEAAKRTTVTLDASSSSDPDGDVIYYFWTLQRPTGSIADIHPTDSATPSFQTDIEGTYVATLQVWDGELYGGDTVTVTVVNHPPVADAGTDRQVPRGSQVTIDAFASSDPDHDGLTYSFFLATRPPGSTASLEDLSAPWVRTFRADVLGEYRVPVTVSDGKLASSATVVITAVNTAPEATVAAAAAVNAGERVDVSSSGSRDRNGDPLTYAWRLERPATSAATLSSTTGTSTSYVPDVEGTYTVSLDLSDGVDTSTASASTVVYPRVVTLSHDVVAAACNVWCSTLYMVSRAPANELWRFFSVPGNAEMRLATLSGPPLAVAASADDSVVVGLSGKVYIYEGVGLSAECALPHWTDSTGALRTYDAGGVALGPRITFGNGGNARTTRFAYVVPAATANGGKGTLAIDMGNCAVTTAPGPEEGFDGAVALRRGTSSLYVLDDGSPGKVWIYDTSTGPATLTRTARTAAQSGPGLWFLDGGAAFVGPQGAVHDAEAVYDGSSWTMPLAGELGNPGAADPRPLVVHASSSASAGRIAAIPATGLSPTPLDTELRTYSTTTWEQTAAVPLPRIVTSGTAYAVRGRFAAHQTNASSTTIWVIERTEPGVNPEGWAIAPLSP